jgi:hypothetical protein
VTVASPSKQQGGWTGWVPGLVLGVIDAFGLLELGVVGLAFSVLSILLIAWKGPRLMALAGLVSGAGAAWTILFSGVMLRCAAENAVPGQGCEAGDIGSWVAIAIAMLVVGLVASFSLARRSARRG